MLTIRCLCIFLRFPFSQAYNSGLIRIAHDIVQAVGSQHYPILVHLAGNEVEVVDCFTYLRVQIANNGSSEQEVRRRIAMTQDCFQTLQNNIWRSRAMLHIRLET